MFLIFPYQYPLLEAILAGLKTWWKLIRYPYYSTHKKKKKLAWVYFKWVKVCGWRADQHLNYLVWYTGFLVSSAFHWEINLWNCMWLKRFKMIQNKMGKGIRRRNKQEKGGRGGNPNQQPPHLVWLDFFNFEFFFPFYKTHNSVCRFSAVYKENMRYADA